MNVTRWLIAGLAAFFMIFILETFIHGGLLRELYAQTAGVWRPRHEAAPLMSLMGVGQLLFGLALAWVYTKGYEPKKPGVPQGLRFGLYAGTLIASSDHFVWYIMLPVPFALNLAWLATSLVKCLAAGAVIGLFYRKK